MRGPDNLQVEAVCRCLLALGVKALHLGELLAKCPALLACQADIIEEQVGLLDSHAATAQWMQADKWTRHRVLAACLPACTLE